MNEKIMKQEAHYDWLKDEVHCLYAENKDLQDRINKAIEYIGKELKVMPENGCSIRLNKILDILKGSDNNDNR